MTLLSVALIMHFITPIVIFLAIKNKNNTTTFFQRYPQRIYDVTTIIIGISMTPFYTYVFTFPLEVSPQGLLLAICLGWGIPLGLWLLNGKQLKLNLNKTINVDTILLLPMCAMAEEIIWRVCFPYYLTTIGTMSYYTAICLSSIGFILLHCPIGGAKRLPYICLFTIVTVMVYLKFGIVSACLYHLTHNMILIFVKPMRKIKKVVRMVFLSLKRIGRWRYFIWNK